MHYEVCLTFKRGAVQHPPSVGAASAWAAARYANGIRPLWSPQLVRRTGHAMSELLPCVLRLVRRHSPVSTISSDDFPETSASSDSASEPGAFSHAHLPTTTSCGAAASADDAETRPATTVMHGDAADLVPLADLVPVVGPPATLPAGPSRPQAQESPTNVTADPFVAPVAKRPRY